MINKVLNLINKMNKIHLLFVILLILLLLSILKNNEFKLTENFQDKFDNRFLNTTNFYEFKENDESFDKFYTNYYDKLHITNKKNMYEIGKIKKLENNDQTKILVTNCDTGKLVNKLNNNNLNVVGIDKSLDMIEKCKLNYPNLEFHNKDILKANIFDDQTFTHILCLNRKIYMINNKKKFFNNCYNLLTNNGFLIINLVDPNNFDFFVNEENKNVLHNPNKYGKKIEQNIVLLGNIEYLSKYEKKDKNIIFKEKFQNYNTNSIRKNNIVFYMDTTSNIVNNAKNSGFIVYKKYNLDSINYNYEYMYIFQKTNN